MVHNDLYTAYSVIAPPITDALLCRRACLPQWNFHSLLFAYPILISPRIQASGRVTWSENHLPLLAAICSGLNRSKLSFIYYIFVVYHCSGQ